MASTLLAGLLAPLCSFQGAWAALALRARRLGGSRGPSVRARLPAAIALGAGLAAATLLGALAVPDATRAWALAPVLAALAVAFLGGATAVCMPGRWAGASWARSALLAGGALGGALLMLAARSSTGPETWVPAWAGAAVLGAVGAVLGARWLAEPARGRARGRLRARDVCGAGLFALGLAATQAALGRAWIAPAGAAGTGAVGADAVALLAVMVMAGLGVLVQLMWTRDARAAAGARRGLEELRTTLARLDGEMRGHRRARDALVSANQTLRARRDAEQRLLADSRALAQLGQRLQACMTEAEIVRVLAAHAGRVLPDSSGMLLRRAPGTGEYVAAGRWGTPLGLRKFTAEQCLASRERRPRLVTGGEAQRCAHLAAVPPGHAATCVPLQASGEDIGLLCIELPAQRELGYLEQLATGIADRVALALGGARLRAQVIRDPLTGLHNRRVLEEALGREVARAGRDGKPLALVLFDIDEFKAYNDRFGHDAGDHAIRAVADALRVRLRGSDVLCRFGGEEFLALLTDTRLHEAVRRAREVCEHVRGLLPTDPQLKRRITLSAGVAAFPDHGTQGVELLRAADAALYVAKSCGRDRVVLAAAG